VLLHEESTNAMASTRNEGFILLWIGWRNLMALKISFKIIIPVKDFKADMRFCAGRRRLGTPQIILPDLGVYHHSLFC
jgi:hypothetical protein